MEHSYSHFTGTPVLLIYERTVIINFFAKQITNQLKTKKNIPIAFLNVNNDKEFSLTEMPLSG